MMLISPARIWQAGYMVLPFWVAAAATTEWNGRTIGLWIAVLLFMRFVYYYSGDLEEVLMWLPPYISLWLITVGFSACIQHTFLLVSSIATWSAFKAVVLWWTGAYAAVVVIFVLGLAVFEIRYSNMNKWKDDK